MMTDYIARTNNQLARTILAIIIVLPGLLAFAHICYLIPNTTSNCLAHDYQAIIPVVDKMSASEYNWTNFIQDTSVGAHCLAPSILVHFLMAHLAEWNAHTELFLGIFLIFIRCLFLADCISSKESTWAKLVFLSSMLTLIFGTCCSSVLLFGNPCIAVGIGSLSFSIGLWSIVKLNENSKISKVLIFLGGLGNACFGSLPTVITWGLYFFASILIKIKSRLHYACLALGSLLSIALVLNMPISKIEAPLQFRPQVFINVLGRSFANNIGDTGLPIKQSETVCYIGFTFLLLLFFCHWKQRTPIKQLIAPMALVIYGIMGALAVSAYRDSIASWYSYFAILFWSGILGSASILLFSKPKAQKYMLVATTPFIFAGFLYLQTNLEYKDKDFYRRIHSPVSESVLRHFDIAPTFAESAIFAVDVGDIDKIKSMAEPLLRRHWSVFAKNQIWSLQGDYLLPIVTQDEIPGSKVTLWIPDRDANLPSDFRNPEHLNLCLADGNSVSWSVKIPKDIETIKLSTAVALESADTQENDRPSNCILEIYEYAKDGKINPHPIHKTISLQKNFTAVNLSLKEFSGKKIKIVFYGAHAGSNIRSVYKHPQIKLKLGAEFKYFPSNYDADKPSTPSNTETSEFFPKVTDQDIIYRPFFGNGWQLKGLKVQPNKENDVLTCQAAEKELAVIDINANNSPLPQYQYPRIGDYSNICIELAKPDKDPYRLVCLQLLLNDGQTSRIIMPIRKDGDFHTYSYETRLFGVNPETKITGIQIFPTYLQRSGTIQMKSVRLVKKRRL